MSKEQNKKFMVKVPTMVNMTYLVEAKDIKDIHNVIADHDDENPSEHIKMMGQAEFIYEAPVDDWEIKELPEDYKEEEDDDEDIEGL